MKNNLLFSALTAFVVTAATIGAYQTWLAPGKSVRIQHVDATPSQSALYTLDENGQPTPLDFTQTAGFVMDAVVHITSSGTEEVTAGGNPFFRFFEDDMWGDLFGQRPNQRNQQQQPRTQPRVGTGSGVIIDKSGYIVTNNHVVQGADDIEVTLHDNRSYKATIVGTDPTTDLALIQIKEKDLPSLSFGNSDQVLVGQWVLAVGNPFNLNSTVTAGIVSAIGRSINILQDQYAIESFIQTDAAINPGNSGGALVNLEGNLIGINSAIASPTGAYSGYGFAVPSNIVKKVIEDLLQYGVVQRGYLGATIRSVDGNMAREEGLNVTRGVYVDSVFANSAASKAGLEHGDVITSIDGNAVNTSPELLGRLARYRPGDKLSLGIIRDGKNKSVEVVLNNKSGNPEVAAVDSPATTLDALGVSLQPVDEATADKLGIDSGLRVSKLVPGKKLARETKIREGFIITKVDGNPVKTVDEFNKALNAKRGQGGVMLEGVYQDTPGVYYHAFGLN